jgi:Zn ribbon nucleic-acid-binding protein
MRSEERSFSYPDSKEDCVLLGECIKCGYLADYLIENKIFPCYNPIRSHKVLKGVFDAEL